MHIDICQNVHVEKNVCAVVVKGEGTDASVCLTVCMLRKAFVL